MGNYRSKIAIIILNFNGGKYFFDCIKAIKRKSDFFFKNITVVDNKSTDGSVEKISRYKDIKIIKNKKNLGYAGGNNVGIRYALKQGADFVFILNPDAVVEKNAVEELLKVAESDKNIGIAGPKIYSSNGKIWSVGGEIDKKRFTGGLIGLGEKDQGQYNQEKKVDYVSGTALFIRKEVFGKAGLFDEQYFLYYEDVDFCLRAKKAGFKIVVAPKAIVYHQVSSSVDKYPGLKEYYMARNHLLFMERWAPLKLKVREFLRMPKTIWEHYQKGETKAIRGIGAYFFKKIKNILVIGWIAIAFGFYFALWYRRTLVF